jgi:hypothetical protein
MKTTPATRWLFFLLQTSSEEARSRFLVFTTPHSESSRDADCHGFDGKGTSTRVHPGAFFAGERDAWFREQCLSAQNAFVEFDLPHVSDSYENQRDLCRSPIGHTGSPCMFCGCEAQPEKA